VGDHSLKEAIAMVARGMAVKAGIGIAPATDDDSVQSFDGREIAQARSREVMSQRVVLP
jgi:hypothetical protein